MEGHEFETVLRSLPGPSDCTQNERSTKMPYIKPERRTVFDAHLEACAKEIEGEGELKYCIYMLATLLIGRIGESYDKLSMCSSAMEHAKLEWYRKKLSPYEDKKIEENGDI